jgi:hypothetical protein
LRLGECDQFRVTADVAIPDNAIVAMGDYPAALSDERRKGEFTLGCFLREFDAAAHHRAVN